MNPDEKTYLDYIREERTWARRRNWRITTVIAIPVLFVIASLWWCLGFTVEKRDGNGAFSKDTMNILTRMDLYEAVIREYGEHCGRIRSLVYCGDAFYAFTSSNKVYTMEHGEYPCFHVMKIPVYYGGDPRKFDFKPIETYGP